MKAIKPEIIKEAVENISSWQSILKAGWSQLDAAQKRLVVEKSGVSRTAIDAWLNVGELKRSPTVQNLADVLSQIQKQIEIHLEWVEYLNKKNGLVLSYE